MCLCVCVCGGGGGEGGRWGRGERVSFWLSTCSVLIVVPLLEMRPSFPWVSWTEGVR